MIRHSKIVRASPRSYENSAAIRPNHLYNVGRMVWKGKFDEKKDVETQIIDWE